MNNIINEQFIDDIQISNRRKSMKPIFTGIRITICSVVIILCLFTNSLSAADSRMPVIGISSDLSKDTVLPNYFYIQLAQCYVNAVIKAGGIPLVIPCSEEEAVIKGQVKLLDGLILSGGEDINPLMYKEEPNINLTQTLMKRDNFDRMLLAAALDKKIPVLGICRGEQFINVFHGGTLYQDIPTMAPNTFVKHSQDTFDWTQGTHTIEIKKDSWLAKVIGQDELVVNSFHHQAVKGLAPGFKITAVAKDGIIEGIEKENGSFCAAVQFHPEMMQESSPLMLKIFQAFVQKCTVSETK